MADLILFISEKFVKDNSVVDENVDSNEIRDAIREAQREHILPLLGTGLYNEIKDQIDGDTLTGPNTTLLDDYVRWAHLYWTLHEVVDYINYKFMNKAIMQRSGEDATPIGQNDVIRLMSRFKHKAELYSQRTTNYLIENETDYPLFSNAGSGTDTIHPERNSYNTGWYLGGGQGDCGNDFFA